VNHFNGKVYSTFSAVPQELLLEGYTDESYLQYFYEKWQTGTKNHFQDECIAKLTLMLNLLLRDEDVSVLDLGGGAGQTFSRIEKFLSKVHMIQWDVVEVEGIVNWAEEVIRKPNLTFHKDITGIKQADVLFSRSAIQLIEDYSEVMKNIIRSFLPKFIHLDGISAGNNIEYVTLILLNGKKGVPCIMLNEKDLIQIIEDLGYVLIEKYLNDIKLSMGNFFDVKYHLDDQRENNTRGYIFLRNI
tara:strand:+ start:1303 stop:2034 length:732 start_codon:yes stop_codon:yes gene_type:complete